jgi:hypothetical protein
MFAYFKEFTCRVTDIVKVVPRPDGGTFVYLSNPDKTSSSGVHRESTETSYKEVITQLAQFMGQGNTAYINVSE